MSSTGWAAIGGAVVVAGAVTGAAIWRHTHQNVPLPLADLPTAVQKLVPGQIPPLPTAPNPQTADRGPEPPSAPNPVAVAPSFDVVRVEKSGDAVIAGKGAPGADVALMASGQKVAEAKADENGQFVMTPPPLKPGSYDLSLEQHAAGQAPQQSKQSVAIAVPENGKSAPVAALSEPGKPTKVLSALAPGKGGTADVALSIRSAEIENGSGFFASGTAPAGARLRLYLNDSHVADATAGADGQWTLRIRNGLTGGHYRVRADSVAADGQKVLARVEVPFDVPVAMAKAEPPKPEPAKPEPAKAQPPRTATSSAPAPEPPSAPAPAEVASVAPPPAPPTQAEMPAAPKAETPAAPATAPAPADVANAEVPKPETATTADAVVAKVETALVVQGDNLWDISRQRLGDPLRYTRIYTANVGQIRNPNLIYPGQVFVVPHD